MTHRCVTSSESPGPRVAGWLPKEYRDRIAAYHKATGSVSAPAELASEFHRTLNIIIEAVSPLPGAIALINRRLEEELERRGDRGILDPRTFNSPPNGQERRT